MCRRGRWKISTTDITVAVGLIGTEAPGVLTGEGLNFQIDEDV
jgi:hypothetical protein